MLSIPYACKQIVDCVNNLLLAALLEVISTFTKNNVTRDESIFVITNYMDYVLHIKISQNLEIALLFVCVI